MYAVIPFLVREIRAAQAAVRAEMEIPGAAYGLRCLSAQGSINPERGSRARVEGRVRGRPRFGAKGGVHAEDECAHGEAMKAAWATAWDAWCTAGDAVGTRDNENGSKAGTGAGGDERANRAHQSSPGFSIEGLQESSARDACKDGICMPVPADERMSVGARMKRGVYAPAVRGWDSRICAGRGSRRAWSTTDCGVGKALQIWIRAGLTKNRQMGV
ncbi:hypothetical protein B0H11DRAFT_2371556 [Mycena galericulata]|nr:hypothetical protein B0H11DRAFT_2371556 [Mycena galericulata]